MHMWNIETFLVFYHSSVFYQAPDTVCCFFLNHHTDRCIIVENDFTNRHFIVEVWIGYVHDMRTDDSKITSKGDGVASFYFKGDFHILCTNLRTFCVEENG